MTNATEFFKSLPKQALMSLNTAMPCKVLSYNESTRTAKIQPLFKVKEIGHSPNSLPPIENVPVLYQKYRVDGGPVQSYVPVLEVGDTVQVVFCQRAIDEAQKGKNVYPGTARIFSITDAVIVGVF